MAWVGDSLVYVLAEAPPSQNDSNLWSMKIDARTGKPLGPAEKAYLSPGFYPIPDKLGGWQATGIYKRRLAARCLYRKTGSQRN